VSANRNKASSADVGENKNVEKKLRLDQIIEVGKKFRQLGLYLFIWYWYYQYKDSVDFSRHGASTITSLTMWYTQKQSENS